VQFLNFMQFYADLEWHSVSDTRSLIQSVGQSDILARGVDIYQYSKHAYM